MSLSGGGLLNKLPRFGVGRKVTRTSWTIEDRENAVNPSYWTITKVIPDEDLKSGKVWGVFCQRGKVEEKERLVQCRERKQWKLLPKDFSSPNQ